MSALLTKKDLREAAVLLDTLDVVLDIDQSSCEKNAAAVSEFAFTGLVKKFPGLCDNIDRSVEEIDAEIKKFERLRDKWKNAKVQGARAVLHATAVAIVGYVFGDIGKAGIAAAVSLVSEGVIALFLRALVAMKKRKKRKAIDEFDPKMVTACEKAKKQKAKDVEKTLTEIAEKEAGAKAPSVMELVATFDTISVLCETLDNEKVAGTDAEREIREKIADWSDVAFRVAILRAPNLCTYVGAPPEAISKEIKNINRILKKTKREMLHNPLTVSATGGILGISLISALFGGPGALVPGAVTLGLMWAAIGATYLYLKALTALYKMTLRGVMDDERVQQIKEICGKHYPEKLRREWVDRHAKDAPPEEGSFPKKAEAHPPLHIATMLEADLDEMETSIERLYLLAEELDAANFKDAAIRDKVIEKWAKQWAKLVTKAPGLCRYLNMSQYGLKVVIDRVEKESELVKKYWKGRNADAAKGAAIAIFARVKGFPPGSEIIAQFALPVVEKLIVLYLKGLWLLHKFMRKQAVPVMLYEAFDLACKTVYPMKTPSEKVILKEEKEYQTRLENGTAAPGLPAVKI